MRKSRNFNTPQNKHVLTDKQVYALISRDVHWLLEAPHDEAYYWKDTIVALVEIVHVAWVYGDFRDPDGHRILQKELLARVCKLLHRPIPHHPAGFVENSELRKPGSKRSVITRYRTLYSGDPTCIPLLFFLSHDEKESTKPHKRVPPFIPDTIFVPRTLVYSLETFTPVQWRIFIILCHAAGKSFHRQLHDHHRMGLPFREGDPEVYRLYVVLTIDLGICTHDGRVDFVVPRLKDLYLKSLQLFDGAKRPRKEVIHPVKKIYRLGQRGRKFQFIFSIQDANKIFALNYGYININAREFLLFHQRASQRMYMFCEDWKKRLPSINIATRYLASMLVQPKQYHHFGMFMRHVLLKAVEEIHKSYDAGGDLYFKVSYNHKEAGPGGYPPHLHLVIRPRLRDTPEDQQYFHTQLEQVMKYLNLPEETCARIRDTVTIRNYNEWLEEIMLRKWRTDNR